MGSITHKFVNPVADDPSFTGTKPSDWNDSHDCTLTAADVGADASGAAAAAVAALEGTLGTAAYTASTAYDAAGAASAAVTTHLADTAHNHLTATQLTQLTTGVNADAQHIHTAAGDGGFALRYAFDIGTTNTPASGEVRFDNATPASATNLYINETDAAGVGVDTILDDIHYLDLIMVSNADKSIYHVFRLSAEFTSGSGVDTIPVTYICGTAGTFADAATVYVSFYQNSNPLYNANTSSQSLGTGRTYVAGSYLKAPATGLRAGAIFRWKICATKTAAGTTACVIDIAFGTAGTTSDTARVSVTQSSAQTAVVDTAVFDITCIVRSVGASGVVAGVIGCTNNTADATGFRTFCGSAVSAGFANNGAGIGAGICMTPGSSAAWSIVTVDAELCNL